MEMVRNSPGRFRVWKPDDADTRSLQLLTENRRQLVNQKTAPLIDNWAKAAEAKGLKDPKKLLGEFRAEIARLQ